MSVNPDRDELIRMVDHVMNSSGCIVDLDGLIGRLEKHFPGCDIGKLIFDPPDGRRLTAAEIVDRACSRKSPG